MLFGSLFQLRIKIFTYRSLNRQKNNQVPQRKAESNRVMVPAGGSMAGRPAPASSAAQHSLPGGKRGAVVLASSTPPSPRPAARRPCSVVCSSNVRWLAPPVGGVLLQRVVAEAWSSISGSGGQGDARRRHGGRSREAELWLR
jgi:hypothetical protein